MDLENLTAILLVIAGVMSSLTPLYLGWMRERNQKRANHTDRSHKVIESYDKLIDQLQEEMERYKKNCKDEIDNLKAELKEARETISDLEQRSNGQEDRIAMIEKKTGPLPPLEEKR